jgi:hypothetical protein
MKLFESMIGKNEARFISVQGISGYAKSLSIDILFVFLAINGRV